MAKKMYDIVPPKVAHQLENIVKAGTVKGKKSSPARRSKKTKRRSFPKKEILFGGGIIALLLGIYFYNSLQKATIEIWPKLEEVSAQETISIDKSVQTVNVADKVIPARYLEEEREDSQQFAATGVSANGGKASGTITIYNKISPTSPLTLKEGTHFLSDSGKYFVTLARVTIPAMKGNTAGSIQVKVQAEQVGDDYNIGAAKFSVPKLSGTSYYYSIWGESAKSMGGGFSGQVKKVTADDLDNAKDSITEKLLSEAEAVLRSKLSPDDILVDGSMASEIISSDTDAQEGVAVEAFSYQAKVKVAALVFKKQDVKEFAISYLSSRAQEDKSLWEESLEISYAQNSLNMSAGVEKIDLQLAVKTYTSINSNDIVELSSRKSSVEITDMVMDKYGESIVDMDVKLWPFWVKKAPANKNKIRMELNFDGTVD